MIVCCTCPNIAACCLIVGPDITSQFLEGCLTAEWPRSYPIPYVKRKRLGKREAQARRRMLRRSGEVVYSTYQNDLGGIGGRCEQSQQAQERPPPLHDEDVVLLGNDFFSLHAVAVETPVGMHQLRRPPLSPRRLGACIHRNLDMHDLPLASGTIHQLQRKLQVGVQLIWHLVSSRIFKTSFAFQGIIAHVHSSLQILTSIRSYAMPAKHVGQICRRCGILEATLTIRAEPLCRECFTKYVHTKVIKRMEAFRTRHSTADQQRKLLLPMSFGVSSVTLLHILDRHLKAQNERTHRTGFAIHVLFVDSSSDLTAAEKKMNMLKERFPGHSYSIVPLNSIFGNQGEHDHKQESLNHHDIEAGLSEGKFQNFFTTLPSATSRSDVASILRTRLVVQFVQENDCEGILWGDSTTKLAEKVLSETAKGRGFTLPWQVADGMSPYGVPFYFPVRDVLKKELISHANVISPPLTPLMDDEAFSPTQAPPSAKNTTIDVLMKQYFESVEENYPSIVSNVVRTSSKLEAPVKSNGESCKLCRLPVQGEQLGIHGWGGDQANVTDSSEDQLGLCYGCARSVTREAAALLP
jgi:cytoplasmic tRNA 2-thiolation protein 2